MGFLKEKPSLVPITEILVIGATPQETYLDLDRLEAVRAERRKRIAAAEKPRTRAEIIEDITESRK